MSTLFADVIGGRAVRVFTGQVKTYADSRTIVTQDVALAFVATDETKPDGFGGQAVLFRLFISLDGGAYREAINTAMKDGSIALRGVLGVYVPSGIGINLSSTNGYRQTIDTATGDRRTTLNRQDDFKLPEMCEPLSDVVPTNMLLLRTPDRHYLVVEIHCRPGGSDQRVQRFGFDTPDGVIDPAGVKGINYTGTRDLTTEDDPGRLMAVFHLSGHRVAPKELKQIAPANYHFDFGRDAGGAITVRMVPQN